MTTIMAFGLGFLGLRFGSLGRAGPAFPALTLRDRSGNPIHDRAGNFILTRV